MRAGMPIISGTMNTAKLTAEILDHPDWTQERLAKHMGVSQGTISRWKRGTDPEGPSQIKLKALHDELFAGVRETVYAPNPEDVDDPPPERQVKLVGYVGAGAEAHFYAIADDNLDTVPAPDGVTESTVAVEVRGTSLGSIFDRWIIYYDRVNSPVTPDLMGRLCVVGLENGKVLVKRLRASKIRGLFNLESNTEDTIFDAAVTWAARVKSMAPR